mmetsp:Transcript_9614/g.28822  ORF Transcript_9614/g.28822 Transcript_9614/m.28822 type:complete len:300 (-) Transcript_9614:171-1070(-)|eukprot:CAMPEP_0113531146 /NCGR_PEP_ID=MMETSP0015_2-20120614/3336_1 /TAXON_ID=2838 /ORGANISM="Odontella" /LENGTH=299 /DNA_ID=CAMNT_0000429953 /DNA_START=89 /DNA_END=988 /DNA_ORIENTATION=+ /assembly_acc=CAM_ASM_000160
MTVSTMAQQHRTYEHASSLPVEVSMIEEAMKYPVARDGPGIARYWLGGLDCERANERDQQPDCCGREDSAALAEPAHTILAAAAADISSPSLPSSSDKEATSSRERTRAVNFIVCDTLQFRQLQSEIRSAGAYTTAGMRNVVNALVDERMEIMKRIQECRLREIKEEREAMRAMSAAEGRPQLSPGFPNGQGIKKDLWGIVKNAQTFIVNARSTAEEISADDSFNLGSSSLDDDNCCCGKGGACSCSHFDASGWEARQGAATPTRRPPREMREFKRSHSGPSQSSNMRPKRVVRVARGA